MWLWLFVIISTYFLSDYSLILSSRLLFPFYLSLSFLVSFPRFAFHHLSYHIAPYCIISHHIITYHITYHFILYYIILYYIVLYNLYSAIFRGLIAVDTDKETNKEGVNYTELGRRYDLGPGSIQSAIARACAEVSTERTIFWRDCTVFCWSAACFVMLCYMVLCRAVLCCVVLCLVVLCCVVLCCDLFVLYGSFLECSVCSNSSLLATVCCPVLHRRTENVFYLSL